MNNLEQNIFRCSFFYRTLTDDCFVFTKISDQKHLEKSSIFCCNEIISFSMKAGFARIWWMWSLQKASAVSINSHRRCSVNKGVLISQENTCFGVCVGFQACNLIKKRLIPRLQHRRFPVKFAKFLSTPNFKNICERLFLSFAKSLLHFILVSVHMAVALKIFQL